MVSRSARRGWIFWLALVLLAAARHAAVQAATSEQLATVQVIGQGRNGAVCKQSGVIVAAQSGANGESHEAWVLTCSHLYRDPIERTLVWPPHDDAGPYESEPVAVYDPGKLDLAILRFHPQRELSFVPLAEASPAWGDEVLQIGYPLGQSQQVRRAGRVLAIRDKLAILEFSVQPGDSGSPLFGGPIGDRRVVGIVWGDNGRAHATPAGAIRPALEMQCESGRCPRGWIASPRPGIQIQEPARRAPPIGIGNAPARTNPAPAGGQRPVVVAKPQTPRPTAPERDPQREAEQSAIAARLDALQRQLDSLQQAQRDAAVRDAAARGERGPAGPTGPAGPPGKDATPDLAQMQALADQYLRSKPLTVQIVDQRGDVIDQTQVTLGGKLRLKLTPVRKE